MFDPVLMEVLNHEIAAISEEMAIAISRTGHSPMMRIGDFGVALCDANGRFFHSGYTTAFQLVAFSQTMRPIIAAHGADCEPGDVILVNDPFSGMGHMPDTAVASPIAWEDEIVAWVIAYSHHTDTGGRFPGGFSGQATSSYEEGLRIPPVKLFAQGVLDASVRDLVLANVRMPGEWWADVEAKLAGLRRGQIELQGVLHRYGLDPWRQCCNHLLTSSHRAARDAIFALPDGRYEASGLIEDDGFGRAVALPVKVAIDIAGDRMTLDFTGSHPQVPSGINCPRSMTLGMGLSALKMIVGPDVPMNDGYIDAFAMIAPEGSIVNPSHPAAVGGRAPVSILIAQLIMQAIAVALPHQVPIMGQGGDLVHYSGGHADGRPFSTMDMFFGGWGGRPDKDGIDGVAMMMFGSLGVTSAELLERDFPIVIEGFGFEADTGGAGRHRGSLAVYRQWRFLAPGHLMVRNSTPGAMPDGLLGGRAAEGAISILNPGTDAAEILPAQTHYHLDVQAGDVLRHRIGGSAGHGDPMDRDPEAVLRDVINGKVTPEAARQQYGVAILRNGRFTVGDRETAMLRQGEQSAPPMDRHMGV